MTKEPKKIFIASSTEALLVADSIKTDLLDIKSNDKHNNIDYEIVIWNEANWRRNRSYFESLLKFITEFDYAVIIFHDDDAIAPKINNTETSDLYMTRDNVLIELGLFIGALGRDSVFILNQKSNKNLKIPSDLSGIFLESYSLQGGDDNKSYYTRPVSLKIHKEVIKSEKERVLSDPQTDKLIKFLKDLISEKIDSALTTRFVGPATEFLKAFVIPLIENAKEKLYICCDFPAYGSLSQYDNF